MNPAHSAVPSSSHESAGIHCPNWIRCVSSCAITAGVVAADTVISIDPVAVLPAASGVAIPRTPSARLRTQTSMRPSPSFSGAG